MNTVSIWHAGKHNNGQIHWLVQAFLLLHAEAAEAVGDFAVFFQCKVAEKADTSMFPTEWMLEALLGVTQWEGQALSASMWGGFFDAEGCLEGALPKQLQRGIHPSLAITSCNLGQLCQLLEMIGRSVHVGHEDSQL